VEIIALPLCSVVVNKALALTEWLCRRLPWSAEEQDIAVRVANLEPAKTIVGIFERHGEGCTMIRKFEGERIRVWCIDEGIPPDEGTAV
jgi:hypothetical protein